MTALIDREAFAAIDPLGIYSSHLERYPGLFMTTAQVAEFLGVSRQEVVNMCQAGVFPQLPRRYSKNCVWRIPKISLLLYLNGCSELRGDGGEDDGL